MKSPCSLISGVAALLLYASMPAQTQQPPGAPAQQPGGGPGGQQGRGSGRGAFFGPLLPPAQQAEVDRINAALDAESKAVTAANSNLVVATFGTPVDKEKIAKANEELAK